jgi:hypothetical protein
MVGGLALVVGPSSESAETKLLAERGETVTATVDRSRIVEHRLGGRNAGVQTRSIEEDIHFTSSSGTTVQVTLKDCAERVLDPPGSQIEVVYDPEQPTKHTATRFVDPACGPQYETDATPFTIAGASALVLAFLWWGSGWRRAHWKWWGAAIGLVLLGVLLVGSAFTENCDCRSMAWVGVPMTLLGVSVLGGRLRLHATSL